MIRPKNRRRKKIIYRLLLIGGVVALLAVLGGGLTLAVTLRDLPAPEELFSRRVVQSTKIYDRGGRVLLYEVHGEERRTVIPFGDIPAVVKNATIAIEDANFYRHAGIDLRGILRAVLRDIASRDLAQGGSTITQQLVKNSLVGRERTFRRKIREAALAIILEAKLDKDKILDLYLNQIPYGANAYGIEAAAETFFGRHAGELTTAQAALLSALPVAPSYYSPYAQHRDELLKRKDYILDRMQELGYLTAEEARSAKAEVIKFLPPTKNIRAPHFVMFVRDYLRERFGEEEVEQGGLIVTTTLDWELQEAAEKIVAEYAARNESLIKAANMALAAIDPRTGEILAMVGSAGWLSDKLADPIPEGCQPGVNCRLDPYVNAATRLRQPGSAFKPFAYATAFKKGLTPEMTLFDVETEFNPLCTPEGLPRPGSALEPKDCYHPQNYDETFRGPVSVRQALAQSLNVPSVKLLYLAGIEDSIRTAEDLGITSLKERERFGLSIVLGGAEVRLLEMVSAYGVLANDGVLNPPTGILKITTADGKILEEKREQPRPVLDPDIARLINDILSDNQARIPVFQPRSSLYFPDRKVAAKTGTTQDFRDAWAIGYTPALVGGVWAGNSDNTEMQQKGSGVMAAAPAWHEFMELAFQKILSEDFIPPPKGETSKPLLKGIWQGDVVLTLDAISGKIATELTPLETRRDVAFGEPHDPLYWIDRADPTGPPPQDPYQNPQYANWEAAFQKWRRQSNFQPRPISTAPTEFDDVHTLEKQPRLRVQKQPAVDGGVILKIEVAAAYSLAEVTLAFGNEIIASRQKPSLLLEFAISAEELGRGMNEIEIRAYDAVGNAGSVAVTIP